MARSRTTNTGARTGPPARAVGQPSRVADRGPVARWEILDAFRGVALIVMIAYHFSFDLAWFGWLRADLTNDLRWIALRTAILSSFLLASGMSLALAAAQAESPAHFWRRLAKIGAAAIVVSIGSWIAFRDRFIWFGVLHAIAVMSLFARPLLSLRGWLVLAGVAVTAVGAVVQAPLFDRPPLQWIGLMTFKPPTEDYVPILPWFGLLLIGAGAMSLVLARPPLAERLSRWRSGDRWTWVRWMGRHSLVIYLVHQPLLIGAMELVAAGLRAAAGR